MAIEAKDEGSGWNKSTANSGHTESGSSHDSMKAAKEGAAGMLDDAKETARSKLNAQKDGAASGIDNVAGALRNAGKQDGGETRSDALGSLTTSAADSLERLSGNLRNKDVGTMLRDVETFARNQPLAFLGLTMAAGFLAVRFLKAGEPESTGSVHAQSGINNGHREDSWTTR